ncbi:MAG TPA: hypothetical protein VHI93_08095 [Candidatus Thermoplasmatota archaeon]|nr:hypothetical protein [Candidatus Thermoplasmatota archaeon]
MQRLLAAAALLLVAFLPTAHADATPFAASVEGVDGEMGRMYQAGRAAVAFLDANLNGRPDTAAPDEVVYLDLDGSGSASYGDLRLTAFDTYPAGSVVNQTNRDAGRPLALLHNAWFSQAGTAWVLDMDASSTLTVGDLRLQPMPAKVRAAEPGLGQPLARPTGAQVGAIAWTATGPRDPANAFYVDMDRFTNGGDRVSPGDLRITPLGLAQDGAPTREEFEQAQRLLMPASTEDAAQPPASISPAAWRALDWFVVGLGILNLVGLVAIARQLNQPRPPRNPFK